MATLVNVSTLFIDTVSIAITFHPTGPELERIPRGATGVVGRPQAGRVDRGATGRAVRVFVGSAPRVSTGTVARAVPDDIA